MEPESYEKLQILDRIRDGKPVSEEEANWAVTHHYAKFGEDGDIDLTHKGRAAVDNRRA